MDEELDGKCIGILTSINNDLSKSMSQDDNILLNEADYIYLKAEIHYRELKFFYALKKNDWKQIGKAIIQVLSLMMRFKVNVLILALS